MDMKSGQRSPVCAESCEVQRMEVTDRALPGLTPPFILVTEIPCCLQACFVFSLHAHHLSPHTRIKNHSSLLGICGRHRKRDSWDSFKITSVLISFSPLLYKSSALHRTLYPEHSPVMSWHEGWDRLVLHLWQAVEAGQVI